MPSDTDLIADLAADCYADLQHGHGSTVETVCRDRPDLVPAVRRRLAALLRREAALAVRFDLPSTTPAAPADAVSLPAPFDGYRPVRLLGRGGMGAVFLAEDPAGRAVAVKVMLPVQAGQATVRARFLREARAAARVTDDHVIPVLAVGETAGSPYLVMPYLAGEGLDTRLARGPLGPGELVRLGRHLARGLAGAHAAGLIHRDLKPANVWLEAQPTDWRARLLDFGLALDTRELVRLTLSGTFVGTLLYVAPEQIEGTGVVDGRCDLYALGVVLYEAATGRAPTADQSPADLFAGLSAEPPAAQPLIDAGLPAPLTALILQLLERNPAARPATADAVAAALAAIDDSLPRPAPAAAR